MIHSIGHTINAIVAITSHFLHSMKNAIEPWICTRIEWDQMRRLEEHVHISTNAGHNWRG